MILIFLTLFSLISILNPIITLNIIKILVINIRATIPSRRRLMTNMITKIIILLTKEFMLIWYKIRMNKYILTIITMKIRKATPIITLLTIIKLFRMSNRTLFKTRLNFSISINKYSRTIKILNNPRKISVIMKISCKIKIPILKYHSNKIILIMNYKIFSLKMIRLVMKKYP